MDLAVAREKQVWIERRVREGEEGHWWWLAMRWRSRGWARIGRSVLAAEERKAAGEMASGSMRPTPPEETGEKIWWRVPSEGAADWMALMGIPEHVAKAVRARVRRRVETEIGWAAVTRRERGGGVPARWWLWRVQGRRQMRRTRVAAWGSMPGMEVNSWTMDS